MPAKAKLTRAGEIRIMQVMLARRALPSDKQLARELRVSVSAIYRAMERLRESGMLHDFALSRDAFDGKVGACHVPE